MSRTSFYRKLKSVLGLTPVDFIRQVRIRRAVQMINEGNDSLSGIAYSVGFSDPKYFSKCFKKDMGMPPAEYKVKAQKKI
jgi:AraC-like DNA-binding protein